MPYSLVGASTLGYDLVRLSSGELAAHVLRTTLRCGPGDLDVLAARHPGPARVRWWQQLDPAGADGAPVSTSPLVAALPVAGQALTAALDGDAAGSAALLRRLETASMGTVHALDRMIRSELLDWTWLSAGAVAVQDPFASAAADVLVDAAASAYCAEHADVRLRRELVAGFLGARLDLVDASPGTGSEVADRMLAELARCDDGRRAAWRGAVDASRPGSTGWASAMHQATWALSVSGRLREAMDVQLAAVGAFRSAGFVPRDAAYGVWNALSGALQGMLAADLLPVADHDTLLVGWRRVHGDPA